MSDPHPCECRRCLFTMSNHTQAITQVKWGGDGLIYSAARDCSINVWAAADGRMVRRWARTRAVGQAGLTSASAGACWTRISQRACAESVSSAATSAHSLKGHGHWVNTMSLSTGAPIACVPLHLF
jgi:hypothetical protein